MKLTLARTDLHRALALVGRVVERRTTIPILGNVLLQAGAGALSLTATDLDLSYTTTIAAEVAREGATTLPAATLAAYVSKLAEGSAVGLDAIDGEPRATLRSGRGHAALGQLAAGDFPDLSAGEMTHSFEVRGEVLAALCGHVAFAISTEETRYYLNGIYLHLTESRTAPDASVLRAVATDGHRLACAEIPAPLGSAGMPGVIVPRKAVAEIERLGAAAGAAPLTVALSTAKIQVARDEGGRATRLTSKLIDGTFPDYLRVIPTGHNLRAGVSGPDLAAAIDRVATLAAERSRAVRLGFGPEGLHVRLRDVERGDAEEQLDCTFEGAPLEIGFSARYAADVLAALDTPQVELAMGGPGDPCLWSTPDDPSCLYVLMPMRL